MSSSYQGDAHLGLQQFRSTCVKCHGFRSNLNGPSLNGVVNRKAGSAPGFQYSNALKNSSTTWNDETLFQYLLAPKIYIKGTTMNHAGINNPNQRKDIIAYLKTNNQVAC